jgi:preprotein translocase subunit SecA
MLHIDAMSRLREEVAFEWYAQRQPLVVYKEKAYEKFNNLIDELEHKTIKSMFSINQIQEVEQVELDARDMNFWDISLQESTKIQNNSNPLFAKPTWWNIDWSWKTKIRV